MKQIPVDAEVKCSDGACGQVTAIVANPINRQLTHFVVQDLSTPHSTPRLVPVDFVEDSTPETVTLNCTKNDLNQMEPFIERHFFPKEKPGYSRYHSGEWQTPYSTAWSESYDVKIEERIPEGELAIHRGDPVSASDGIIGEVEEFLVDPQDGSITHMVIVEARIRGRNEITLPVATIDRIQDSKIFLKLDKQEVASLPAIPIRRHYHSSEAEKKRVELFAILFDQPDRASEALDFVVDLHHRKVIKILNAATLVKDAEGKTVVKDTRDVEPRGGRLAGAITGGLLGLLGGPVGFVVGALAGAGTGGLAAKWIDMGFSDKFLNQFQETLKPDSSAIVVLVEHEWAAKLSNELADLKGMLLQHEITEKLIDQLIRSSDEGIHSSQ